MALGLALLAIASAPLGIAGAQQQPATPALQGAPADLQPALSNLRCSQLPCDPGVRTGAAGAGDHLQALSQPQIDLFNQGLGAFKEVDTPGDGLGPGFNLDSCAGCHAQPAVGGSSPAQNPQVARKDEFSPNQPLPSFLSLNGPVREARFINNPDGTPDGGVHDLFMTSGCNAPKPDFQGAVSRNNVIFRIPTPTFGAGLIAAIPDSAIVANMTANSGHSGVSGRPNRTGNDGTITRFGWKAQNKSLTIFAGEAYNVEQGVTNELFPNERVEGTGCSTTSPPEDFTGKESAGSLSDVTQFALFMEFLAPPKPAPSNLVTQAGLQKFTAVGCNLCHTPMLRTGTSSVTALSNVDVNLYSDLLIHDMGPGLADQVSQGAAGGREFRTAPLWGVGQRVFFLHDGRTSDLLEAIKQHDSSGSEASTVIGQFNNLNRFEQESILLFLRSL